MNSVGSVWRKWDLHIHTPASFKWDAGKSLQYQNVEERDKTCSLIVDRMNELDIAAFCIMDYWTFEGYLLLREYIAAHPHATTKTVFPGIELRMEAPTDFRLNTHVLISDQAPVENLQHFLSALRMGGPDGKPPSRQHLIDVARNYDAGKLRLHGFKPEDKSDDEKMYRLGVMTVEVTRESVAKAMEVVGRENCLLIQPYGCSDGIERLDWEEHPYSDHVLMKWADGFETRKQSQVDLFLGTAQLADKQHIADEFLDNIGGYPKPVVSGSDAHEYKNYGVYPSNRVTWLKAQPTFKGLKQVCHEPPLRCLIGERPAKLVHIEENPTKYITHLRLSKVQGSTLDEHWFHDKEVHLNPGLIAIIGNKGSGKSAISDILALGGNSHCSALEFLNEERFRDSGNKAAHFEATITWADGTSSTVNLSQDSDLNKPERIRYLPQHFIETLCNEIAQGNNTNFSKELQKVIFSHVKEDERLGCGSLDELLSYLVKAHKDAFAQEQQSLFALNETIWRCEQESGQESIDAYEKALALKQLELDAVDKSPLITVEKPAEDPDDELTKGLVAQIASKTEERDVLATAIATAKIDRQTLIAEQARLRLLGGHIGNFESQYDTFVEMHDREFEDAGFQIADIVSVAVNRGPVDTLLEETTAKIAAINLQLDGKVALEGGNAEKGLVAKEAECAVAIQLLQDGLNAPQKAYQAYLNAREVREVRRADIIGSAERAGTSEYLKDRIKRAKKIIPAELIQLRDERREIVRNLHRKLLAMRDDHVKLYAAVQKIASEAAKSAHAIQLEFDASVAVQSFDSDFLNFIHRGRTGTFQGDDDSKSEVKSLLKGHDFNDTESVVAFTDAVLEKLTNLERNGTKQPISIVSQLRDRTKAKQLYDFLFGLSYLSIRYNLRLGGKEISQLSPGEKGALLLVFYLLLDTEEIPIIIDQPEHNLDNESVVRLLVDCIRKARARRQVLIVTHNPNLAVYCDADQIVCCSIDKTDGHKISYSTGAIEDYDINSFAVNVLEGTYLAFDNRRKKWHKPVLGQTACQGFPSDDEVS